MENQIIELKASLEKNVYRIIHIKELHSLEDLAEVILKAFDFELDHAFGFYDNLKNPYQSTEAYELFVDLDYCDPSNEEAKSVRKTSVGQVFTLGRCVAFLFDYGDDWIFEIECIGFQEAVSREKYPRICKSVGQAPQQYPDFDDEEEVD